MFLSLTSLCFSPLITCGHRTLVAPPQPTIVSQWPCSLSMVKAAQGPQSQWPSSPGRPLQSGESRQELDEGSK